MDEKLLKCLYDIKLAIEEVDSYFENMVRTFHVYHSDVLFRRAIERNLEIIGEAINRILKLVPHFSI
jgi:uncharacterized protein with HEPN domain